MGTACLPPTMGAGTAVALDLETGQRTDFELETALRTAAIFDVEQASPGILFASSIPRSGAALLAVIDLLRGTAFRASLGFTTRSPDLVGDGPRRALYGVDDLGGLLKIDIDRAFFGPELARRVPPADGPHRLAVSRNGAQIVLSNGEVRRTDTLDAVARVSPGVPQYDADRALLYVAQPPGRVDVYSAASYRKLESVELPCAFETVDRMIALPEGGGWLVLGGQQLCGRIVPLSEPGLDGDGVTRDCDNCPRRAQPGSGGQRRRRRGRCVRRLPGPRPGGPARGSRVRHRRRLRAAPLSARGSRRHTRAGPGRRPGDPHSECWRALRRGCIRGEAARRRWDGPRAGRIRGGHGGDRPVARPGRVDSPVWRRRSGPGPRGGGRHGGVPGRTPRTPTGMD